jgi:hypothetical protein
LSLPIALVFLLLVGVAVALSVWRGARRRDEIAAWASGRGLTFRPDRDGTLADPHPAFRCLHRGSSRYAYNVARGEWNGRAVVVFDYHYATQNGKQRQDHRFSAVLLASRLALGPLLIRPEGLFDRLTEFLGFDDIDFESAEFSRDFHVTSPDRRWAYDVLNQATMEFLLSQPRFSIQFDDRTVLVWRDSRFDLATFEAAIEVAAGLLDRLPSYVVEDRSRKGG